MFENFFKVALRNLLRNKAFSIINISGLAIGMAGAILILLWIQNELSYDQFHENKDRIYEAWNRYSVEGKLECSPFTPKILGTTLKEEYPEIQNISRFNQSGNVFTAGEKKLRASGAITDPEFLTMFSFPLLKGNVTTALAGVYSIVITEKFAKKLFGDDDPMNKTIRVVDRNDNFTVTGVLKDLPNNTQFNFEYLLPWEYMKKLGWDDNAWSNNSISTFIEVKPGISETFFNDKIKNVTKEHSNGEENTAVFVHPISKWRLYSKFENGRISGGRIEIVRLLGIIAVFILLIACINFMNLSTAGSEKRAKEVGIRKVIGAQKNSLIAQFLGESILIAFLAGILALILAQFFLPSFNLLTEKKLSVSYNSPWFWLAGLSFVLVTGANPVKSLRTE